MSKVDAIIQSLLEGDEDGDFKDAAYQSHFTYRLFYGSMIPGEPEEWLAQMLWDGSPYGVVAKGQNKAEVEANAQEAIAIFNSQVTESLEDDDDFKDVMMPLDWTYRIKRASDGYYNADFFYNGKFRGSCSSIETEELAEIRGQKWIVEFNKINNKRPFDQQLHGDVWQWYYGFKRTSNESLDDDDEIKDFAFQGHGFAKGTKVRVITGRYAGEPGIVEGPFHWGNGEIGYWIHLDDSDDPASAITYRVTDIEPLTEAMEDFEPEALNPPPLDFSDHSGAVGDMVFVGVHAEGKHIGTLYYHINGDKKFGWRICFISRNKKHVNIPVQDQQDGARRLWDDYTGENKLTEAMEDEEWIDPAFTYIPLTRDATIYDVFANIDASDPADIERAKTDKRWMGRIHAKSPSYVTAMGVPKKLNHPQPRDFKSMEEAAFWLWHHWELEDAEPDEWEKQIARDTSAAAQALRKRRQFEQAVAEIVNNITEASDDDDDTDMMKDMSHDPVLVSGSVLQQAGFNVTKSEQDGDSILLKFDWPIPNATAKINGFKRAMEALEPIIGTIKNGDYRLDYFLRGAAGNERVAEVLIRKRIEDDPERWKIIKKSQRQIGQETIWSILFNGQEVGEVYTTGEGAERLRREIMEIHKQVPFNLVGWQEPTGTEWAKGPVINWWRAHRTSLPRELLVGEHFLDKSILGQQ